MAYSRNEYLQSLNRMRANYQSQGNPLINTEDDNGNVGNELSSFAYMNTEQPSPEQASASKPNAWKRTADTLTGSSVKANVTHGVMNVVDDVVDFLAIVGGWIGGLFAGIGSAISGEGFEKGWNDVQGGVQQFTQYDWQAHVESFLYQSDIASRLWDGSLFSEDYWNAWGDTFTDTKKARENVTMAEQSGWENELEWVGQVEQGIGYVLPSLVVGFFTGGTSLGVQAGIQAGITGASAIGAGFEQATAEGADYGKALGYGATKGIISAGTSALTYWIGGNVVKSVGGSVVSNLGKKAGAEALKLTGSKTAEVITGKAVEITAQAGISGARAYAMAMADPALKTIYNDKSIAESYSGENLTQTLELAKQSALTAMATSAVVGSLREGVDYARYGKDGYMLKYYNEKSTMLAKSDAKKIKNASAEKQSAEDKLSKQLKSGKISEEEYNTKMSEVQTDFEKKVATIRNDIENKTLKSIQTAQEYAEKIEQNSGKTAELGSEELRTKQREFKKKYHPDTGEYSNEVSAEFNSKYKELLSLKDKGLTDGQLNTERLEILNKIQNPEVKEDLSTLFPTSHYGNNEKIIKSFYEIKNNYQAFASANGVKWYENKDGTVTATNNNTSVTFDNSGKPLLLTYKGDAIEVKGGDGGKFLPVVTKDNVGQVLSVISNTSIEALPVETAIKSTTLNIPNIKAEGVNTNLPFTISKDVSSKILNKSNSREIMNFLENGLRGKGKENFVMKATNGEKYIVVEPYKDGQIQKYGIITINGKTNEILDITVKSERPSVDRAYIVPKIDEQKLLTTKLENSDGTAIVYDVKNIDFDGDVSDGGLEFSINSMPSVNRAVNEGGFIYSKNPLRVANFKKEIPFARLAKIFNIPTSLEKTYELKLRDPKNELSVLKWVGKRSGLSVEKVLEKLGYDSIVKSDNSVTFFSASNILHRGVEYKHGKRSENYSDLIKRNVSENTRKELENYVGTNGKELITEKDGFEYSKLIRETLSYSPQEISYGGEKYEVKIIDPKKYTPDMLRVFDKGKKIGVRTRFALRMQEAEYDKALSRVSAYWAEGGKDIIVFVDSGRRGTLEQTATHELGHAIFDKLHGWTLLDVQSKIEYLEKNHPLELLKKKELYCAQWDYDPNEIGYDNMIYEEMFADTFAGLCEWEDKTFQNNLIKEMTDLYEKGSKWANKQYYEVLAKEEAGYLGYNYTERAEISKGDDDGHSLVPKKVSTNRPTEREIIKSNANLKHEKVYSLKTTNQIVDNALVNMLNKWNNAIKISIPTGKTKLKEFTFEELNLYKDKDKAIENIVKQIESAIVTFDNGTNGHEKIALKDLGMHDDLTKVIKGLVAHKGELSEKSKWVRHYIDTLHRYAGYVHERALLRSEYVTANKAQKTLDKIFEDTRTMKIGGDTVVNEITLYKQLTSNLLLSKSAKNVAPSTFTKLVNNFNNYTAENYADYFDVALKDLVDELALSFEDGKFPNREPTLNEMQLFNAIRGRIIARCRTLISEKHQLKIKNNEFGTKLASVALPAIEPKRYGKVKNVLDSAISFPVKIRSVLGANHPFVKLFTENYLRVSANAISKTNEFRTYNFETLAKEAGYAKRGALLKDLKKKVVEIKDRNSRVYKKTVDDVIGAYWIYKTAQEQLLATGLTAYNDKNKTDVDFKIDDELYQDMFNKLPESARKWADLVYEKYFNGMDYEYKMSIIKEFFGDLNFLSARKGTYAPTSRVGQVNMGVGATSQFDAGYLSTMLKGFLKERVKNKNHFRWISASDTLEHNMQQVATWGEKSQWVDDVRSALNTTIPGVGNHTLEYYLDKHVPEWKQVWSPYMSKIILGKQILEKKHGLLEFLGNVGQISTLGGNIGSILRQTLSDFSWTFDERVTWRTWLSTIPQAVSNFFRMGSIKKELMENNGYFIERFNEGEVIKAIMNGKLPFKIGQIVLKPMEWLDSVVVSTHGYALAKRIVNDGIKKGYYDFAKGSPEYKREVAHVLQGMTLISQSNADPMFLSRLRSGDAGWLNKEAFGRFGSDNQNKLQAFERITREKINSDKRRKAYEEASKDDKYSEEEKEAFRQASEQEAKDFKKNYGKKIAGFVVSIILNGLGAYAITHFVRKIKGKEEWDEFGKPEEVIRDIFLESTVNWVPYISTIANAIENNSDVSAFTVDKLNNLVDMVKLVETAFEKGDETSIKRAIWALVTNGLELTGIPANNIYQLFMGIWYQFDKDGSLSAQSWVKGYNSSYMKSQYTSAITSGNTARAKAQLGAWSSMYSTNITDETTLDELVRLSMVGYNATPSANATSYTNDKGDKVSFTSAQANAFKTEYAKSNKTISELLKIEDYKKQDDKVKASIISKIYNAYRESAQAKALGVAPNSKLAQFIYYSNGDVNLAKYIMSMQNLSVIKGDEKQTRKERVVAEINKLRGFNKNEKLLLAYLSGYSVSEKNQKAFLNYLTSLGFTSKEAKEFVN